MLSATNIGLAFIIGAGIVAVIQLSRLVALGRYQGYDVEAITQPFPFAHPWPVPQEDWIWLENRVLADVIETLRRLGLGEGNSMEALQTPETVERLVRVVDRHFDFVGEAWSMLQHVVRDSVMSQATASSTHVASDEDGLAASLSRHAVSLARRYPYDARRLNPLHHSDRYRYRLFYDTAVTALSASMVAGTIGVILYVVG